jgi:hypothetical protein
VLRQFKLKRWACAFRQDCGWIPYNAVENRFPLWRSGSPRILSLSVRVLGLPGQEPNLNLVSAENVDIADANKLIIANVVATIAVTTTPAATATRGHEIEFVIRQFDRVSEIGHILHVGLLSVFDISGGIFAVTAATLSLAARHQSGCTSAKTFLCVTAGACFSISFFIFVFHSFLCFWFFIVLTSPESDVELSAVNIFIGATLWASLPQTSS